MARKTKNEYVIQSNYGYGWDDETTEETHKEAKEQLKCYKENVGTKCNLRIVRRKVLD